MTFLVGENRFIRRFTDGVLRGALDEAYWRGQSRNCSAHRG